MNIIADFLSKPTQNNSPQVKKSGRGIYIKSPQEIETMRQAAKIVATVLKEISERVSTWDDYGGFRCLCRKTDSRHGSNSKF